MYTAARACARAPRRAKKTARGNRTPTAWAKATSPPIRPGRFVDAGAAPQSRLTTTLRWRTAFACVGNGVLRGAFDARGDGAVAAPDVPVRTSIESNE